MQGRGRFGGNRAGASVGGFCVCSDCGYRTKHGRGRPCMNRTCPKCGGSLTRE